MSFLMTFLVAVKALRRNALRTALTALGMIIGVAAVIVMVAIGTGARSSIEQQIRSTGSNVITVNAGGGGFGPVRQGQGAVTTLTDADAQAIQRLDGVRYVSPGLNTRTQIIAEHANWNTQVQGAGDELVDVRSWALQYGTFLSPEDVRSAAKVVVLGSVARDQLFGAGADPTGDSHDEHAALSAEYDGDHPIMRKQSHPACDREIRTERNRFAAAPDQQKAASQYDAYYGRDQDEHR